MANFDFDKVFQTFNDWHEKLKGKLGTLNQGMSTFDDSIMKPSTQGLLTAMKPSTQGLLTAGLSMMATPPREVPYSNLEILGKGGLAGLGAYNEANKNLMTQQMTELGLYPKIDEMLRRNKPAPSSVQNLMPGADMGDLKDMGGGRGVAALSPTSKGTAQPLPDSVAEALGVPKGTTYDQANKIGAKYESSKGEDNLNYHIEKESIGNKQTQDFRVFIDKKGNVTKREKVGVPYANTEGTANIRASIFGVVPNATTGAYFVRTGKKEDQGWYVDTADGKVKLTSEQMQNLGLTTKEMTPTARTKTMQQLAPKVLERAVTAKKLIEAQMSKLGPVSSRTREIWARKIGGSDPEYTAIRTTSDLLATLLANMHVGASGAEKTIERFSQMLEVKNQSPDNLLRNIEEIIKYATAAKDPSIKKMPISGQGGEGTQTKATHRYVPGKGIVEIKE
jgi:hypothetical protein